MTLSISNELALITPIVSDVFYAINGVVIPCEFFPNPSPSLNPYFYIIFKAFFSALFYYIVFLIIFSDIGSYSI